ncbi:unnamed protein product [Musa acuminata subsp. malaccensis]|uniref:(wild Malaysian banana) hypothetical protein n=1 Tax=Musa acuminata subsp. malaccensis TaxID=214687 RepID=A0A804HS67_MUSAM|nr:PREDICTED: BOI-related E3 ubiquitin-protein ligase 1-like [Musa acuminata subsp. malaccensis]CAG1859049.1 unnamed protein product [Musa acuminata subsp. malaccensis]
MVIRAQRPSGVPLLNGGEERTGVDCSQHLPGFLDPSAVMFSGGGATANPRKRGREEAAVAIGSTPVQDNDSISNLLVLGPSSLPPTLISLAHLRSESAAPLTSTGLQLAFGEQQQQQRACNPLLPASPALFEKLAPHLKQHQDEIDGYLRAQALLSAAATAARQRIKTKEAEVEQAARQSAELERLIARLRAETLSWQAKAVAAQTAVAGLQAQLQRATEVAAAAWEGEGESGSASLIDQESAAQGSCRACRLRNAAVVVLPCRHLSLCADCAAAGAADSCPACGRISTGSLHVAFS